MCAVPITGTVGIEDAKSLVVPRKGVLSPSDQ